MKGIGWLVFGIAAAVGWLLYRKSTMNPPDTRGQMFFPSPARGADTRLKAAEAALAAVAASGRAGHFAQTPEQLAAMDAEQKALWASTMRQAAGGRCDLADSSGCPPWVMT